MRTVRLDLSVKTEVANVMQSAAQMMTVRMVKHAKMELAPALMNAAVMKIASMARSARMTAPVPAPLSAASVLTVRMATSVMSMVTASLRGIVTRTGPAPWLMESATLQRLVAATPLVSIVTRRTNSASRAVTQMRTACLGQSAPTMYARTEV